MDLLDIGGGFCSGAGFMGGVPFAINAALDEYFPAAMGIQIIAEPGRSVIICLCMQACSRATSALDCKLTSQPCVPGCALSKPNSS